MRDRMKWLRFACSRHICNDVDEDDDDEYNSNQVHQICLLVLIFN